MDVILKCCMRAWHSQFLAPSRTIPRAALGWTAGGGCLYVDCGGRGEGGGGANGAAELCSAWTGETPVPTRTVEAATILLVLRCRLLHLLRGFGY